MDYIVEGMISMLRSGDAKPDMTIHDLQAVCSEPELHEYEDFAELQARWEAARTAFRNEQQ
jgi:hypothetical protein